MSKKQHNVTIRTLPSRELQVSQLIREEVSKAPLQLDLGLQPLFDPAFLLKVYLFGLHDFDGVQRGSAAGDDPQVEAARHLGRCGCRATELLFRSPTELRTNITSCYSLH